MPKFFTSLYYQFLATSGLEWLATLSGFLCVYLAAKQNILNWPISIISVCTYAYLFFQSKLYGDAVLQLYFLSTAIYGWYYWRSTDRSASVTITRFNKKQLLLTAGSIVMIAIILGTLLRFFTDTDVPYIDGFCTAISFVAQFLLTRKVLQNWLLWIIVDICYIPLYIHKDLILTAVLYIAFTIIAWNGYRHWLKTYNDTKHNIG